MQISPINLNSFKGLNCNCPRKPQLNIFTQNNACDSVSFSGKAYKKRPYDCTSQVCETEHLKESGKRMAKNLDNRTNLFMREVRSIGDEAEKVRNLWNARYAQVRSGDITGVDSYSLSAPTHYIAKHGKKGEVSVHSMALFNTKGTLKSVHIIRDLGETSLSEKFVFDKSGEKIKEYQVKAKNDKGPIGYRKIEFNEYENGAGSYSYETGVMNGNKEIVQTSGSVAYSPKKEAGVAYVGHTVIKNGERYFMTKQLMDGLSGSGAMFYEGKGTKPTAYDATSLRNPQF